MQTILLVTLRQPVAELLIQRMRDIPDVRLINEPDYIKFSSAVASYGADTILIEVHETGEHGMAYCLSLCGKLRKEAPGCRSLLLCPEQDATGVSTAVEAKRDGRIDDFLFYNATTDYIMSKLLAM
jgi:hypothetical protein